MLKIESQNSRQNSSPVKNGDEEILKWSVMLGCTMEELTKALAGVGASTTQAQLYLKTKKFTLV
jgi:hypothetical protein